MLYNKEFSQLNKGGLSSFELDKNDYKIHKPFDKYFKNVMSIAGEGFMKLIGFPIRIKHFHDSEKINEISGELHIDKLLESFEPKMYIVEFQTDYLRDADFKRFGSYQTLVFKETGLETIVIVVSLTAKEDSDKLWGFGDFFKKGLKNEDSLKKDSNSLKIEYGFTPHIKSLTSMDLLLYLNIMDEIVVNKKKPDEYALAILFSIPFMTADEKEKKKLIFKTAEIALKLNMDDNLLTDIKCNLLLLAQTVLDVNEYIKFCDVIKMLDEEDMYKLEMYERQARDKVAWEEGREEGREEGVNKLITAVKMVKKGVSLEEASKATGLRVNQISTLLQI